MWCDYFVCGVVGGMVMTPDTYRGAITILFTTRGMGRQPRAGTEWRRYDLGGGVIKGGMTIGMVWRKLRRRKTSSGGSESTRLGRSVCGMLGVGVLAVESIITVDGERSVE